MVTSARSKNRKHEGVWEFSNHEIETLLIQNGAEQYYGAFRIFFSINLLLKRPKNDNEFISPQVFPGFPIGNPAFFFAADHGVLMYNGL